MDPKSVFTDIEFMEISNTFCSPRGIEAKVALIVKKIQEVYPTDSQFVNQACEFQEMVLQFKEVCRAHLWAESGDRRIQLRVTRVKAGIKGGQIGKEPSRLNRDKG